jgi:uncharacterized protein (TIGR00369 family)
MSEISSGVKFSGAFGPHQAEFIRNLQEPGVPNLPKGLRALGIRSDLWLKEMGNGYIRYVWPNTGDRDIGEGRAFGGWIAALSDHVVSICMHSALTEGEYFTTQDLQVKYFRPVMHGDVTIIANVVNRSRTTGYVEAEWRNENGKLAAKVIAWKAIRSEAEIKRPRAAPPVRG